MIDATAVARLREQHAAATAGEWWTDYRDASFYDGEQFVNAVVTTGTDDIATSGAEEQCHADAAYIAAAHNALPDVLDALEQAWRERDALTAELAQVRGELATGKPQPTQQENDDAAARIKRIDELWERYGLGGCYNVADWPEYAQSEYERLDKAQREYEAKYC